MNSPQRAAESYIACIYVSIRDAVSSHQVDAATLDVGSYRTFQRRCLAMMWGSHDVRRVRAYATRTLWDTAFAGINSYKPLAPPGARAAACRSFADAFGTHSTAIRIARILGRVLEVDPPDPENTGGTP